MTIEKETAVKLAHQERIAKIRARTGGEQMHVDHYDFREAMRDKVLSAMDEASDVHSMTKVLDKDLPALFRTLDDIAETLWLRRLGLEK